MGFPILVRCHLYTVSGPCVFPIERASAVSLAVFFDISLKPMVEQTVELPVIVMAIMS